MPELPEVETIRNDLRRKVLNTKIVQVEIRKPKAVNFENKLFIQALRGNKFKEIDRRGKLMIFRLKNSFRVSKNRAATSVLVHLKMTGQLIYEKKIKDKLEVIAGGHKLTENDFCLPNKHTQVILTFDDKGILFFNDLRRFGYMKLATDSDVEKVLSGFGIEPLTPNFTYKNFLAALGKRKVTIKVALLDQKKIAGIGNIYADEVCFCANVLPTRPVASLTSIEKKKLFTCIPEILKKAIKHRGTTFKDYLDSSGKKGNYTDFLQVFDREGEKCPRCGGVVKKIKSNGRGTHFCPGCQK
ncbi:MAG: bifunctional DNA-formamidopyrimidine glycosylase/DNA-(apurinic or apyrimidinic site) lyase [Patescibacteria group bacterium]